MLHALKAAVPARAAPPPPHVGLTDLRGANVASSEDSVAQMAALRLSADMSGLTAAVDRWSAAEPAVGSFEDLGSVCEIVILPEPTGESRNRSRGAQQKLNGFNSRCVSVKTNREEASERKRTIGIVDVIRYRRRRSIDGRPESRPSGASKTRILCVKL